MFRQGESCIQAGDIIDLIKKKNNIVPEAEKAKFHQLLEQNLMTNLPQFSVIFSAYTTLLTVNDEGQFETHCDAKPYLEELKASRNFKVKLIAEDLLDERKRFLAENPSIDP